MAGRLPNDGDGAPAALEELIRLGEAAATRSAGPRFFHFVTGGSTPAALAADWLTSTFDQNAFAWISSPVGGRLEQIAVSWLKELFELPASFGGVLTTGATMSNFVGLAAARHWWAERQGVNVEDAGLGGLPQPRVYASGYLHSSDVKALAMLGFGRSSVRRLERDAVGHLDLEALQRELRSDHGSPAILIGIVGDVNDGSSDPIPAMANLAERYGAWLHVDGAFGLFGRVTPRAADLAAGVERADSVIADGHKWLNVPYDCGFAFVKDASLLAKVFTASAAYLPSPEDPQPQFGYLGPEMSRRARGLTVWATLRAYGRAGYRAMVERHLDLAQRMAARIDAAQELERLADVRLNVVCFRLRPPDVAEAELDGLNTRLGEAIIADGRFLAGTTRYGGVVALRPAIANWRTTEADVDAFVDVVRELGARVLAERAVGRVSQPVG
jgi:glutamate/tyrosine decarboxylase-like PLP-dependent enzyme